MNKEFIEKLVGKKMTVQISYPLGEGFDDFAAYDQAMKKLKELGVSAGSMQRGAPIGLAYGDADISKWRNLGEDVKELDGVLIADDGSFRSGCVTIYLAEKPVVK